MKTSIKILGPGCNRCRSTLEVVRKVVDETGIEADIVKVEDYEEMMKYNILSTPVVVVNEEIKISGRVPTAEEVRAILA
jgi:small redox-active disulfide protein 2